MVSFNTELLIKYEVNRNYHNSKSTEACNQLFKKIINDKPTHNDSGILLCLRSEFKRGF